MTEVSCDCGKLQMDVTQEPIIVAECYCNSCREGRRRIESLPGARQVVGENGSTHYVLYRKDRIRIISGREQLRNFRLKPGSQTRRVIATCCNTPVLVELKGGHWASLYGNLWHGQSLPKADLRTMTGDVVEDVLLDRSIAFGRWETAKFFGKLLGAWIAMGFKSPSLALDTPEIEVRG